MANRKPKKPKKPTTGWMGEKRGEPDKLICRACLNSGAEDINGRLTPCRCGTPMIKPLHEDEQP